MKEVVIGFLGCGNVGGGVWNLLENFRKEIAHRNHLSVRVKKVLVRDVKKARSCTVPAELLTTDVNEVVSDPEISIVVEFMGGEQPATEYMLRALNAGKTVVTANKVALALNWHRLQAAAQQKNVGLYYEASVCGAIPIINVLQNSLQANRIGHMMGIINGTTNYILSRMYDNGEDYKDVLGDAQRLGLAEPNPAADVEGLDAAYKLSIMSSLAFHARVPYKKVYRMGQDFKYFYIFRDQYGGYMIPREKLGDRQYEFRDFMEKKTGQVFQVRRSPFLKLRAWMRKRENEPYHL